jgi:lipopolysaccharide transport system ATP-binding protein
LLGFRKQERALLMSSELAIKVENLSKFYPIYESPTDRLLEILSRKKDRFQKLFWALKDVSFEILKGDSVGIIGFNGSGKSTLLQLICGTLNPSEGSLHINGRIAALLELGSGFNPNFTGRENINLNAALLGLSQKEIDRRFDEIIEFADIGDFIEQPTKTYSSGMLMRLAFAVSVCVEPDILVIDEALAVGDAQFQLKCLDRMKVLAQSGTTLLFVSHDMGMVKAFCKKAIYLERGSIKLIDTPEIVSEEFYLDVRERSRDSHSTQRQFIPKKSINNSTIPAFGTDEGSIHRAYFNPDQSTSISVEKGSTLDFTVELEYSCGVTNPSLSVAIYNHQMIEVGGKFFYLQKDSDTETISQILNMQIPLNLLPGKYFLMLRLESRISQKIFTPIDKQNAALSIVVTPKEGNFLGMIDLDFRMMGI